MAEKKVTIVDDCINQTTDTLVPFIPNKFQKFIIDQNLQKSQWLWDMYTRWAMKIVIENDIKMDTAECLYSTKNFIPYLNTKCEEYYAKTNKVYWPQTMYYRNKRFLVNQAKVLNIDEWIKGNIEYPVIYNKTLNAIHSMYINANIDYFDLNKGYLKTDAFIQKVDNYLYNNPDPKFDYTEDIIKFSDEHQANYNHKAGKSSIMMYDRIIYDTEYIPNDRDWKDVERIFIYRQVIPSVDWKASIESAKYYLQFRWHITRKPDPFDVKPASRVEISKYRKA